MSAVALPVNHVPRGVLIGAACLIAFTIVAALAGRITGVGTVSSARGTVAESRELRFEDGPAGEVIVRAAPGGQVVVVLAPKTNHFVRTTMRGLARVRRLEGIGAEPPFRLSRFTGGRLTLEDPTTRRRVDLDAFGHSNVGAFSAIMDAAMRI